uniref:Uncharacterized protein n=1 Tax=Aotus nancymaae TaxID=37293 RepID=A0A2K5C4N0_AOTNA
MVGNGHENKYLPKFNLSPAGEDGSVARAQKCKLITHPTLPHRTFPSFPWVNAGAAVAALTTWTVVWVDVCGGASWCLGGDKDEEVFPYCINEYLYD